MFGNTADLLRVVTSFKSDGVANYSIGRTPVLPTNINEESVAAAFAFNIIFKTDFTVAHDPRL